MTAEEMDARKAWILETLMDENLSMVDLQYFENMRLMILEERKKRDGKVEDTSSNDTSIISEATVPYEWQDGVNYALDEVPPISRAQAEALKARLRNFLLEEVKTEEELEKFEMEPIYWCPLEELQEELRLAEEEFERGEYFTHKEVGKMIEGWK